MTTQSQFLSDIETYLVQSSMTATVFGRQACGNPNFVFRLRDGRDVTLATVDRVRRFMAENPPPAGETQGVPDAA